ncbi:MAG: transporter related, partial [Bacillales bacterium]|nr:transporter related [Bacillales bacterium]
MSMIQVNNLKKAFGQHIVLKDVSLTVDEKEVVCIIGPSGSGKSTFLRCLNRLEKFQNGSVIINNHDLSNKKGNINDVRKEVGMVFQQFNLFPHKTVLQNIMLAPMKLLKMDKASAEKMAMNLLDKVGLKEKKDSFPSQLSGGQQQRVAIARALAMNPKVML